MKLSIISALAAIAMFDGNVRAEEQPSSPPTCPVDTTQDADTGQNRNGVKVCYDDHSASVGGSVSGKELDHFLKYPIGQSDKSVAKQIGNAVHNFFSHL
ncbi:hypothetical protein [Rhizobium leguminosarum]|uniref:Uncharacterized protein n=1 Tax=Rhizobium leguminosarum TaxID=384 RepID=A0A1B1CHN9_RHILE|nr:hypothetical protein [Rhizobium leguminosarum]ANP89277.1 hypothetical protein BA011_26195 [Rhizobium leguminosarum]